MENQRSALLSWDYYCRGKSAEELRQSLLYKTMELEQTRIAVQEELRKRDDQLLQLKDLLSKTMGERDEAQSKCRTLVIENRLLQQQIAPQPLSRISSTEDEPRRGFESNNGLSSSDCDESIVSSPVMDSISQPQLPSTSPSVRQQTIKLEPYKTLPEKGKFLQAVMKAGPLLQTLLLAGPLPQWRHPPPPIESFEIPPVTIPSPPLPPPPHPPPLHQDPLININSSSIIPNCGRVNRKRVVPEDSDSPTGIKYRKCCIPLTATTTAY